MKNKIDIVEIILDEFYEKFESIFDKDIVLKEKELKEKLDKKDFCLFLDYLKIDSMKLIERDKELIQFTLDFANSIKK